MAVLMCRTAFCGPDWAPVTAAELAEDRPQIEPSAAAEILSYRVLVDDTALNKHRDMTWWVRYKIYDPGRTFDLTRVSRFWRGRASPYYDIRARLTLPDGSSRMFGEDDMRSRNFAEEGQANGILRVLGSNKNDVVEERFLAVTGVVKGAVLDIWESEPRIERTDWLMLSVQRPDTPIRQFEFEGRYAPDPYWLTRGYVLNPSGGKMSNDPRKGVMRFTAQNLPSVHNEEFAPPDSYFSLTVIEVYESLEQRLGSKHMTIPIPKSVPLSLGPWAMCSTAKDYQDADKGFATKRVKEKADELTAGVTDPMEKARRIYAYVENLYQQFRTRADLENWYTRYVDSLDELIDLDTIDSTVIRAEDFNYLFVALVRSAGLECHSVFHPSRSAFPFRTDMVSEHFLSEWTVAVKVGEDWVLCTPCEKVPLGFGELPWEIEGEPALMAMPRKQAFLDIPPLAAEKSLSDVEAELTLGDDGSLAGDCVLTLTGHSAYDVRLRLSQVGREEWGTLAKDLLGLESSSCEANLVGIEGVETPGGPVRVHARVRWPSYAPVLSNRMSLVLAVWASGRAPLLNASERTSPVFFHYARMEHEHVTVHLPAGYRAGILPKPIEAAGGAFSYSLAVKGDSDRGTLEIERSSRNGVIEIPVHEYPKARDWFRRVSVADQMGIMLTCAPRGTASRASPPPTPGP